MKEQVPSSPNQAIFRKKQPSYYCQTQPTTKMVMMVRPLANITMAMVAGPLLAMLEEVWVAEASLEVIVVAEDTFTASS